MSDLVYPKRLVMAPGEIRTLYVDFQAYSEIKDSGETLTGTPTVAISPTGPTLGSPSISGTKVVVAVTVGSAQAVGSFNIKFTVNTSGGSTLSRKLPLDVRDV